MNKIIRILFDSNLRTRLLVFYSLLIPVLFSIVTVVMFGTGNEPLQLPASEGISNLVPEYVNRVVSAIQRSQYGIILVVMIISIISTTLIVERTIMTPIKKLGRTAKRMADGHLDETVSIPANDEIGIIGKSINDLAVNQQETLLFVWNHSSHSIRLIERIKINIKTGTDNEEICDVIEVLKLLQQNMEELQSLVRSFHFYDICIDGDKILASNKKENKGA